MSTPLGPILSMWEAEGNKHAAAFDACTGAVVIGERPSVAAEVALGIARVQARRRRVAVADTVGELGPLEDLVPMDAPYGLVDSFFYGVSLNKIAYPVDPARNLIILPSGAAPIDHEALLGSDRWGKLLEAFRAAEGLLLIVAPAESSALSSLIQVMDGVVLVGNVAAAPGTRVLAHARIPVMPARPTPSSVQPVPAAATSGPAQAPPAPPRPSLHDAPGAALSVDEHDEHAHAEHRSDSTARHDAELAENAAGEQDEIATGAPDGDPAASQEEGPALVPPWARDGEFSETTHAPVGGAKAISFWVAIVGGALAAAALLTWLTTSVMSRNDGADSFAARPESTHTAARVIAGPAPTAPAATAPAPRAASQGATVTASPGAAASTAPGSPFSVVLANASSVTGANGELDQASGSGFPGVTYAPYPLKDGSLAYVVLTGAFPDSAGADSLLRAVRAKRYRTASAAHVARLPYAVLIQKGISREQASMFVRAYQTKGLPVYPLLQADGTASLWAGAFRTAEQAQPLVTSFRANGDQPTVMIRTGRSF